MSPQSVLAVAAVALLVAVLAGQVTTVLWLRRALGHQRRQLRRQATRLKRLSATVQAQHRTLERAQVDSLAQMEALLDLRALVQPTTSMPSTQGWAATATTMQAVFRAVTDRRPATVVECGSGTSSVWIGYALRRLGQGRCVSLEHDARYAAESRELVRRHGLEDVVDVRLAPLEEVHIDGEEYLWYSTDALSDLTDIGVVFVDGPPGTLGPRSRFPAVPLMAKHCADEAVFLLDDTARSDEQEILRRWVSDYDAEELEHSDAGTGWDAVTLKGPRRVPTHG